MMFKYVLIFLVVMVGFVVAESSNGDGCIFRTSGEFGVCASYSDCEYSQKQSCSGILPQPCRSYAEDNSVCCRSEECPPLPAELVSAPLTGYKAWDYCVSLAEVARPCQKLDDSWTRDDACPQPPDRDVTEAPVETGEYPHLVLLGRGLLADINWTSTRITAGTLISDRWVLGSAIAANLTTFAKIGGITDEGEINEIETFELHPDYHGTSSLYDSICLFKLRSSVTFSKNVLPACLHTGSVLPEEKLKEISREKSNPYTFNSWDVSIMPHQDCFDVYSGITILPDGVKESTQFCVSRATAIPDVSSSLNGAPLQVYNGASVACTQTVLGVFINMYQKPLFIRVSAYIPWIESMVWPSDTQT